MSILHLSYYLQCHIQVKVSFFNPFLHALLRFEVKFAECSKQLLQVILLWLKERFTSGIVLATLSEMQTELYLDAGFTLLEKTSKTYKAIKSF